jgi:hypothetical protein
MTQVATFQESVLTTLNRKLMQPGASDSTLEILSWWEARRSFYNMSLALSGLPSIFLYVAHGHANVLTLIVAVLLWSTCANLCYTLGPAIELVLRKIGLKLPAAFAPFLFQIGVFFSIGLTFADGLGAVMGNLL